MKDKLFKVLRFLSLMDTRGSSLSITNIAVIVCITKIGLATNFSITEVAALMLSLLNYGFKRTHNSKYLAQADKTQEE